MLRFALVAGVAGLLSTAAMAQPVLNGSGPTEPSSATMPEPTKSTSDEDGDKVICRTVKPVTGTRVSSARSRQKVCQTKRDWEIQEKEAQELIKSRDSGVCAPGQCSG